MNPHSSISLPYSLEYCTSAQPSWWSILPRATDDHWTQSGWHPLWPTNVSLPERELDYSVAVIDLGIIVNHNLYLLLFFMCNRYVKKIIEDANTSEDTVKLLKFCCWENPLFSSVVLSELLWQIAYSYTYELRPYLDLLLHMLLLEDSWQNHRIHNALKGRYISWWWWWCLVGHLLL